MNKLPPIEKIFEAWSAIADNRIEFENTITESPKGCAYVSSSNLTKTYTVTWNDNTYSSNDNASYWQGYPGYPIIAILMLQNKLHLNQDIIAHFTHIDWNMLNAKYKTRYSAAVEEILSKIATSGTNIKAIRLETESTFTQLTKLNIICRRSSLRPPK